MGQYTTLLERTPLDESNYEGFDQMIETLDLDYPYIAGMIDGDGYIYKNKTVYNMGLYLNDREIPEMIASAFKERLSSRDSRVYHRKRTPENRCQLKVLYGFTMTSRLRTTSLLKRIYPFMIEKQGLAAEALNAHNHKIPFPVKMTQDQFTSYLAGFMDAEGHISSKARYVSVANTMKVSIDILNENIRKYIGVEGRIDVRKAYTEVCPYQKTTITRKPLYKLNYTGVKMLELLQFVFDKIKIKRKRQAALDIVYWNLYERKKKNIEVEKYFETNLDFWKARLFEKEKQHS